MTLLLRRRGLLSRRVGPPPGAFAWWQASDLLHLSDSSKVDEWPDRSGNGHDLSAPSTQMRPTINHAPTGFNGYPAVYFGGAMTVDWVTAIAQPWHAFCVIRPTTTAGTHYIIDGLVSGNRLAIYRTSANGGVNSFYAGANDLRGGTTSNIGTQLVSARASGTSSQLRVNGVVVVSGNAGSHGLRGITLGARFNLIEILDGWIAEVLLYQGAQDSDKIAAIEAYLFAKYGIT